jgi:hypothetical protein
VEEREAVLREKVKLPEEKIAGGFNMATSSQWQNHFKTLTNTMLEEYCKAIEILFIDDMFSQEFNWTGLQTLSYLMKHEIDDRNNKKENSK